MLKEARIRELAGGALLIPSFSEEGKAYKTHPESGYCQCPRHQIHGICVKHRIFADAILKARDRKSYGRFNGQLIDEDIFELCKAIFSKVGRHEHPADSCKFANTVASHSYSTKAMRIAAWLRHEKVLLRHEAGRRAA